MQLRRPAPARVSDAARCTRGWTTSPWVALLATCVLACSGVARAESLPTERPVESCGVRLPGDTRPRVGLALGGGGARGIAHVSVLRVLEERGVRIDCIAGTSMGALVGGLYASGMTVDELEHLVLSTDWKRLFDDSQARPERSFRRKQDDRDGLATLGVGIGRGRVQLSPGLLQGQRILAMLERSTLHVSTIDDFDRLPIPYRAVATDLNTGEAVVLGDGSLAMAMRASMSLPGIFQPVEVDGHVLLDGGLANQVPVDVVRAMGAERVVAVDVGTPLAPLGEDASVLAVVSQLTGMMTTGNTKRQLSSLRADDVLITPDLGDTVATGDFTKAREALAIGAEAGASARERLGHLAYPAQPQTARPVARSDGPGVIHFVRIDNQTDYSDEFLLSYAGIPTGVPLDPALAEEAVVRVYGLGTLSSFSYEVVREQERAGVVLRARPKPQGPNYLQLGLSLSTDFEGRFESNLRAALLFSPLSPRGAEGRVTVAIGSEPALQGEYYHPVGASNRNFLYTKASYENPDIPVFDATGNNTANYDVKTVGVEFKAVREFGNHGAMSLGVQRAKGRAEVEVGDPQLDNYEFDHGKLFANVVVDRLDSLFFPRSGYYAMVGYGISRDWLGSDSDFDQVDFDALVARSFDSHALQLGASYHATVSGTLPVESRYRLGGRGRLAGYHYNELTGQHYALLMAGYTYQLGSFLGRSAQVGGTLEYGNAWERREDMAFDSGVLNASLYAGFDSWLGPMLFGFGWREGGDGLVFLEIGRPL